MGSADATPAVLGLDIGGANLKAAHSRGVAQSRPFALWKQPDRLAVELRSLRAAMPAHERLAVTMTGELCDCFAGKAEGVRAILRSVQEAAAGVPIDVWTTAGRFVTAAEVCRDPLPAAAANWLALAQMAARYSDGEPAVLLDTGSTTTDIVYLERGKPAPHGLTDRDRLASGELVYTGIRRTPVCAVLGLGVAAEWFATMLDAYLWLEMWPEGPEDCATADGRPATRSYAAARLARLRCADAADLPMAEIDDLTRRAIEMQVDFVRAALERVIAGRTAPRRLIVAGSGHMLGRLVFATHPVLRVGSLVSLGERLGPALSEAACAYAVALLAAEGRTTS